MPKAQERPQVLLRLKPEVHEVLSAAAFVRTGGNIQALLRGEAERLAKALGDEEDVQLALKARKLGRGKASARTAR